MPLPNDEKLIALSEALLEKFQAIFGANPGMRPAHAKGVLLTGEFTPEASASALSRAPHFSNPSTPITVRFSNSTGIPLIPDNDPNANPRGIAVRFHLGERVHTDIVAHSTDGFPTHTGEEFLEVLQAIASSAPGTPSPTPLEIYVGSHPAALAFVQTPKPAPVSFATEGFFGVTAMEFLNAEGASQFIRYQIFPEAGLDHLDEEATKAKEPNYLFDEIAARVKSAPVVFKLKAQLAGVGEVVDNATIHWAAESKITDLGTITLTSVVEDNAVEQKHIIFDPIPRVDGIEPSDDPLLELRAAIYLISGRRRRSA
jgi:catalase